MDTNTQKVAENENNDVTEVKENTSKTFTQEQVNNIVQQRLKQERSKIENTVSEELKQRTLELEKREREITAKEALKSNDLPVYLIDAINTGSEEELNNSIEALKRMKGETVKEQTKGKGGFKIGVDSPKDETSFLRSAFGLR